MQGDRTALVLGGGGITGIAWELGLLAGLSDLGVHLATAEVVIGTSAGSVVAAQLTSGAELERLYEGQLRDSVGEVATTVGAGFLGRYLVAALMPGDDRRAHAWIGQQALASQTVPEAERRDVIAGWLPVHDWPDRRLLITALRVDTAELVVFDRGSGVPLVDAVAASCAVPTVWPPMTIGGHRYMDGGVRSATNADLASGCGRVVVLAPSTGSIRRAGRTETLVASLGAHVHTAVVSPDRATRSLMGHNPLDPAFRAAAARAGRAQAAAVRDQVALAWGSPPA